MQERAERTVDQSGRFIEFQIAHVTLAQVEAYARVRRASPRLAEHRWGSVYTYDSSASLLSDRNRDPAITDREFDQRPFRLTRQLDVEAHVGRHSSRPFLVAIGKAFVPAHAPSLET
jgi:hypothetical protein